MSKYGARACESILFPGVTFPSQAERDRAEHLHMLEMGGEISDLELHPRYVLSARPRCVFTADARYREDGRLYVEDTKGVAARDFRVRALWAKQLYPDITIRVVKRSRFGWDIKEVA